MGPLMAATLVSAGAGLLGNAIAGKQERRGAGAALEASRPYSVTSPFGSALFGDGTLDLSLEPELANAFRRANLQGRRALSLLNNTNFQQREENELERLRRLRAPQIDEARSRLQSQLLSRGRLGLGRGGGLTGGLFNPETAALEEAIARAQLGDIAAARDFARADERHLLAQAQGLFGVSSQIGSRPLRAAHLGILASTPAAIAAMQGTPYANQAAGTRGFFGGLAQGIGGLSFGGSPGLPPTTFGGGLSNSAGGLFL